MARSATAEDIGGEDYTNLPDGQMHPDKDHPLHFPFRDNTIARHARSPGLNELNFQFRGTEETAAGGSTTISSVPMPRGMVDTRRESGESIGPGARQMLDERTKAEEGIAENEEKTEILRAEGRLPEGVQALNLGPQLDREVSPSDANAGAALRERTDVRGAEVEDSMEPNPNEKQLVRKEKLAERLQDVFGLEQREEVLEEYRCWLLRSVSEYCILNGRLRLLTSSAQGVHVPHPAAYLLLRSHAGPRCACGRYAQAGNADWQNHIVKTGPLMKKASRTKINSKFWVVLRNDVLSWFESTAVRLEFVFRL